MFSDDDLFLAIVWMNDLPPNTSKPFHLLPSSTGHEKVDTASEHINTDTNVSQSLPLNHKTYVNPGQKDVHASYHHVFWSDLYEANMRGEW